MKKILLDLLLLFILLKFFYFTCKKMINNKKNLSKGFITPNKLDAYFKPNKAIF